MVKSRFHPDNYAAMSTGVARSGVAPAQQEEQRTSLLGYGVDAALGVPRGVEDFAHSVYNLADYFAFDSLPDWDEQRLFGHSKTWAGELTNGITQFATGFIPALGVAGKIGKASKALSNLSRVAPTAAKAAKWSAAGAASDFISFEGHEERLSNLIQSNPSFANPITEYLAADDNDNEIEGRFKNVMEGLLLEAGIGSAFKASQFAKEMLFGVKNIKKARKIVSVANEDEGSYKKLLGQYNKGIKEHFDDSQSAYKEGTDDMSELKGFNDDFNATLERVIGDTEGVTSAKSFIDKFSSTTIGTKSRYTELLKRLNAEHGTQLDGVKVKMDPELANRNLAGVYNKETNTISINPNMTNVSSSRVFTHELVHAITAQRMRNVLGDIVNKTGGDYYRGLREFANSKQPPENKAVQRLVTTYLEAMEHSKVFTLLTSAKTIDLEAAMGSSNSGISALGRTEEGVANTRSMELLSTMGPQTRNLISIDEFVSEALSNTSFARTLDSMKAVNTKSLWSQIKDAFKLLVHGTDKPLTTLLDDVLDATNMLSNQPFKAVKDELNGGKIAPERLVDESAGVRSTIDEVQSMQGKQREFYSADDAPNAKLEGKLENDAIERAKLLREISGLAKFLKLGDGKITGGTQAIKSAVKNIDSTNGAWAVITALAKNLDEAGTKAKKLSADDLNSVTEEYADILGGDKGALLNHINKLSGEADSQAAFSRFRNEQAAVKEIIGQLSRIAVDEAKEIQAVKNMPAHAVKKDVRVLEAELLSTLDKLTEAQRIWSLYGREGGLNLVQRKLLGGRYGFNVRKNVGLEKEATVDKATAFRDHTHGGIIGGMKMDKLVKLLVAADDDKGVTDAMIKAVTKQNRKVNGSRLFDMTMEYWINSLLSGPSTQIVNLLGNGINLALRQAELVGGAVLSGDLKTAEAALKFSLDMDMIRESASLAVKAMKNDDSLLVEGARQFDDREFRTYAINSDRADSLGEAINYLGHIVRVPTRLLIGGDEFFKQMSYRSNVKFELAREALHKGLQQGDQIAKYVEERFDDYITEGGRAYSEINLKRDAFQKAREAGFGYGTAQAQFVKEYSAKNPFDEEKGALADRSVAQAREATFTNRGSDGVINKISNTVGHGLNQLPLMKFVVPFLQTPTNILKAGIGRSPLAAVGHAMDFDAFLRKDIKRGLMDEDPIVRARARGQMATGVAITSSLIWHFTSNPEMITGGGPATKEEKEAMKLSGWQPYSVKIGGKYFSYNRLDPLATTVGIIADMKDAMLYRDLEPHQLGRMFQILSQTVVNNVTSKSFLEGIDNLTKAIMEPERRMEKFIGGMVGGFTPNILNQAMNLEGQRELYEARGIFDNMLKRTPLVYGSDMPKRRNFLGEVVKIENPNIGGIPVGPFNPFYMSSESKNPLDLELARLGHGFSNPTPKFLNSATDLRKIYQDGRQAYDRLLELSGTTKIGGKTLRQTLTKLVNNPNYKKLPYERVKGELGIKSPRINEINKIINAYRAQAKFELVNEFEELQQHQERIFQGRISYYN